MPTTCKECGAPMQHLDAVTVICSRLYALSLRRFKANDHREVSHASLAEVPDVVAGAPGLVFTRENAPSFDPPPPIPPALVAQRDAQRAATPGLRIDYVTFTERGIELGLTRNPGPPITPLAEAVFGAKLFGADEDEDPEADEREYCGQCGGEIVGHHACEGVPGGFGDVADE